MDTLDPQRRMGLHGRLVDTALVRALVLGGPDADAALAWLERVGDGVLAVSAWSVLQLEGQLASLSEAHRHLALELLVGFLEERAPVAWFTPEDFAMVRQLQRHRPALAPLPLLLQLQQAFRLGLLPATLNPLLVRAAADLGYPVEEPGFTSSAWGTASSKPSWR